MVRRPDMSAARAHPLATMTSAEYKLNCKSERAPKCACCNPTGSRKKHTHHHHHLHRCPPHRRLGQWSTAEHSVASKMQAVRRRRASDQFIRAKAINGVSGVQLTREPRRHWSRHNRSARHQHRHCCCCCCCWHTQNAHFDCRNYSAADCRLEDNDSDGYTSYEDHTDYNDCKDFNDCKDYVNNGINVAVDDDNNATAKRVEVQLCDARRRFRLLAKSCGISKLHHAAKRIAWAVAIFINFCLIASAAGATNKVLLTGDEMASMLFENLTRHRNGGNNNYNSNNNNSANILSVLSSAEAIGDSGEVTTSMFNLDAAFSLNESNGMAENATEYIFDRTDIRVIFITLYSLVFCCCFFGNLLVILVVTMSRRLRSITNFFLANLAVADFCVGLFCVMQNLSIYLIDSWVFGEFLCRMYQFVHSLSYTASIFILVVICMERYFAIVHPITCKQILTAARLRIVILTVWIGSAVYSTPKFIFSKTIKNIHTEDGQEEEICVLDRKMYNSKLLDMINFGLLYVIPLVVMTVLYSKIAIALWRSSHGLSMAVPQHHHHHHPHQQQTADDMSLHNSMYQHHHHHHQYPQLTGSSPIASHSGSGILSRKHSSKYDKQRGVSITESQDEDFQVSLDADRPIVTACRKTSFYQHQPQLNDAANPIVHPPPQQPHALPLHPQHLQPRHSAQRVAHMSHSTNNVLRARRGVVRMLIIFVLTFALCNLPYHARKMWQYWSRSYRGDSNFNALLTPLTFLVTYFNSGVNPLLYAFLSRNFRKGMKELLLCSWKKGKGKSSTNSSMHHKRIAMQTHSIPTENTHIGNDLP